MKIAKLTNKFKNNNNKKERIGLLMNIITRIYFVEVKGKSDRLPPTYNIKGHLRYLRTTVEFPVVRLLYSVFL